jgi:hypothetical protein
MMELREVFVQRAIEFNCCEVVLVIVDVVGISDCDRLQSKTLC